LGRKRIEIGLPAISSHGIEPQRSKDDYRGQSLPAAQYAVSSPNPPAPRIDGDEGRREPSSLYATHFSFVWRNLRRLGIPEASLEDAAQDAFLIIFRRWNTYDAHWSSLETWLFGILIRVASNYRRTFRRRMSWLVPWQTSSAEEPTSPDADSPSSKLEKRQTLALLDRALAGLDEKKRVVLLLGDVEELSVPQAAQVLSINVNTAYFRLRVARKCFQQSLNRILSNERHPRGGGQQ
jgi:RNA polymerase sigma-70 factor (ECF subfamily)